MDAPSPPPAQRPFGDAADLGLDLAHPDRPAVVTALLAQCGVHRDPAFWWAQPVGARTAALLRLVELTHSRPSLPLGARCAAPGCGAPFEFELPLQALSDAAAEAGPLRVRVDDGRTLAMRLPTGNDLRRWRDARPASRADAVRAMLDSLLLAGQAGPGDEAPLSAALAAADPLVAFAVACRCPACDAPAEVPVDLESLALGRLQAQQQSLLQDVHRLASRYGWTEAEVMAVPAPRRARYLALIEDEREDER